MKRLSLVCMVALAAVALVAILAAPASAAKKKDLIITYNAGTCVLSWNGPAGEKYAINLHTRTMTKGGESKLFSVQEQMQMHELYRKLLIGYVLESEKWFLDPEKYERQNKRDRDQDRQL